MARGDAWRRRQGGDASKKGTARQVTDTLCLLALRWGPTPSAWHVPRTLAACDLRRLPAFRNGCTDLGQKNNALPVDGYAAFLQAMRARGFSEHDVNVMSKDNPAKLLGLR